MYSKNIETFLKLKKYNLYLLERVIIYTRFSPKNKLYKILQRKNLEKFDAKSIKRNEREYRIMKICKRNICLCFY